MFKNTVLVSFQCLL